MSNLPIKVAEKYDYAEGLWVITCFFNPNDYATKPVNYYRFISKIQESGINHLTVELAFGKQPFTLLPSKNVIQLRTKDVMWQKERLLNIAISHLPSKCKYVAWVDCDILFCSANWAVETVEQLRKYKVVQPFKEMVRLPKDDLEYRGAGASFISFGYVFLHHPLILEEGRFDLHGHTGFAWASHKSILQKYGLYDVCIAGSADHLMAHAFVGDWDSACIKRMFGNSMNFYQHFKEWSEKIYPSIKSKIGYTDGMALHLWHGDTENRKYAIRERSIENFGFDPLIHLRKTRNECWNWNHRNKEFTAWAKEYFVLRKEDG